MALTSSTNALLTPFTLKRKGNPAGAADPELIPLMFPVHQFQSLPVGKLQPAGLSVVVAGEETAKEFHGCSLAKNGKYGKNDKAKDDGGQGNEEEIGVEKDIRPGNGKDQEDKENGGSEWGKGVHLGLMASFCCASSCRSFSVARAIQA